MQHTQLSNPSSSSTPPYSVLPPIHPSTSAPTHIETNTDTQFTGITSLKVAQLNCFNGKLVTLNILADKHYDILLLQEPWVNPSTRQLPSHQAWHEFTQYDYTAQTYNEKTRTGIYVTKRIPSWLITFLPSRSPLLTALDITIPHGNLPRLRVISAYNPPTQNTGLPLLQEWLTKHNERKIATLIGIDGNLHHTMWNPSTHRHTHPRAKKLIRICGSSGFKIISQRHIPTFFPRAANARPTTLDLKWINHTLAKQEVKNWTSNENYGSDHQVLLTEIALGAPPPPQTHNSARLATLEKASFCEDVENMLSNFICQPQSTKEIHSDIQHITDTLEKAFSRQGKMVQTSTHRHKSWWDEEKLNPLLRERTRARRWMIISRSEEAKCCYWDWNTYVKSTINELKRNHWRAFLAKSSGSLSYKAFKYTQQQTTNAVAPLYRDDKTLATDKYEQAKLLFIGTSIVHNECDMTDIPPEQTQVTPIDYQPITEFEVETVLQRLPNKKAKGGDGIPNEILKLAKSTLLPHITVLFNTCLKLGYFPRSWRQATTAILRKADKEDYSVPGAYRPTALLSCMGKVLETILSRRMAYWAETRQVLAHGHMGGASTAQH